MKFMTVLFLLVAFFLIVGCDQKNEDKPTILKQQPEVVSVSGTEWLTDFEQAKKVAAEKNLPILAYFSGSDWCHWCIKLDEEVFSTKAFKDYVKDNFVLLLLDFPRSNPLSAKLTKQNKELAFKYGVSGFPTILILDKNGKELQRGGYMQEGGPESYIHYLKSVKAGLK